MKFQGVDYYQIDELLSEDEKMTRNLVREFLEKELEPLVVDAFHEEKPLDMRALAPKMGELGMIGACLPEEYGGNG
ncbi:MAG: acyl-CoA dehydrogenase, partial [Dehalococcoidia bacterium]|nr:acyl-CoA dehydrogenase [Dehalococcoidia bacterium]